MRNLIDIFDLSVDEIDALMALADDIIKNPRDYCDRLRGKKLATLFFEPSTRTRLSFEAAMYELGGNVLGFSEAGNFAYLGILNSLVDDLLVLGLGGSSETSASMAAVERENT